MNELDMTRVETIVELNDAFNKAIVDITKMHGDDPRLPHMIASAYTMSINQIDKLSPGFTGFMIKMLEDKL